MTTNLLIAIWSLSTAGLIVLLWRAHCRLVLVARASHELRGPLCAAQLGLSTLAAEPVRVAAIDLELQRAGRALEDLAAARSGERAGSRARPVDLAGVARAHAPTWRVLAESLGAELRLEIAPTTARPVVEADPLRIAQACANLVGNAAEHGGGIVRVSVRATDAKVRLEVADDGPGLPAPVTALTAAARTRRGRRGHGLAIAAAIAAEHRGRLFAAPSSGGARLILELPAARTAPRRDHAAARRPRVRGFAAVRQLVRR
jgi:signal transduction histidine kinase